MRDHLRGIGALFIGYLFAALLMTGWSGAVLHDVPLTAEVGSIGIQIGVAPNPVNTLAEDLRKREVALDLWEADLRDRMAAAGTTAADRGHMTLVLYLAGGLLFALVLVNFYLDFKDRFGRGEHDIIHSFRSRSV